MGEDDYQPISHAQVFKQTLIGFSEVRYN